MFCQLLLDMPQGPLRFGRFHPFFLQDPHLLVLMASAISHKSKRDAPQT
jgi:hypothetical protein